jgi:phosphate transport system substrate-binding protein
MGVKRQSRRAFLSGMGAIGVSAIAACQTPQPQQTQTQQATNPSPSGTPVALYGVGATFPYAIYQRWFSEYNRLNPNVQVSYQPTGSAAGIQQFAAGTADFGASDIGLPEADKAKVSKGVVLIPTVAGSIAVVYNVPELKSGLKLSRAVLPDIFLGKITQWNDPAIAALNPELTLPDLPIILVHRSDGSGTTAGFTAHLSAISPEWQTSVGTGLSVEWKAGTGIKDNSGMAAQIQQAPGTIGYIEYSFAKQLGLAIATLQNKANQFVPLTDTAVAQGLASIQLDEDLRGSVADPNSATAYPIITYSWVLAYQRYADPNKAKALRDLLQWGITTGQAFGPELGYVPLPADIAQRAIAALAKIGPA